MSIILKGIDRPKRGETLNIKITDNGMVWVTKKDGWDYYNGYAIQIPKDHGRIIDEDEAIKEWCEGCAFKDTEECADCKDKEMCKYAPTLLEREETE